MTWREQMDETLEFDLEHTDTYVYIGTYDNAGLAYVTTWASDCYPRNLERVTTTGGKCVVLRADKAHSVHTLRTSFVCDLLAADVFATIHVYKE